MICFLQICILPWPFSISRFSQIWLNLKIIKVKKLEIPYKMPTYYNLLCECGNFKSFLSSSS
jgi:hypothetical protein